MAVTRAAVFFLAMVVVVAILMRQAAEVRVELADSSLEKQLAGAQKMFADEKVRYAERRVSKAREDIGTKTNTLLGRSPHFRYIFLTHTVSGNDVLS